jgi:hypothetical protein
LRKGEKWREAGGEWQESKPVRVYGGPVLVPGWETGNYQTGEVIWMYSKGKKWRA